MKGSGVEEIMRKIKTAGILAVLMLWLTACGTEAESELVNTLSFSKDGSVENTIVEVFDKEYYNLDALNTMIQESIEQYQKQNLTAEISVISSEVTDGQVRVRMKYDSAASYMGYNSETLFVGTIQDAYSAGYDLDISLTGTKDTTQTIGRQELLNMGEKHIVIMELPDAMESMRLVCYGEILYTGDGVSLVSKKTADIEQTQGYSVVVFK